jgi:hypothetical protein
MEIRTTKEDACAKIDTGEWYRSGVIPRLGATIWNTVEKMARFAGIYGRGAEIVQTPESSNTATEQQEIPGRELK